MVRLKGIEPLAHSLEGCCSIHLSYRRVSFLISFSGYEYLRALSPYLQSRIRILRSVIKLVGARGFEPPAFCSQSRRATGLRHAPRYHRTIYTLTGRPYNTHTPPHCQALCPNCRSQKRQVKDERCCVSLPSERMHADRWFFTLFP